MSDAPISVTREPQVEKQIPKFMDLVFNNPIKIYIHLMVELYRLLMVYRSMIIDTS